MFEGSSKSKGKINSKLAVIEIINRQRQQNINVTECREFSERALQAIQQKSQKASIVFVSDAAIKKLNREFRGKDYATDVLSFPVKAEAFEKEEELNLGEVVVCLQRASEQAKQNQISFQVEVKQLILHGLLHLSGYDHETDNGEMDRLELRLRKRLGIA